ncbi:MAG: hypothetical protein ACREEC_00170 [Thermoplasmata archaeon]
MIGRRKPGLDREGARRHFPRLPVVVTGVLFSFLVAVYVAVLLVQRPEAPGNQLTLRDLLTDINQGKVNQAWPSSPSMTSSPAP